MLSLPKLSIHSLIKRSVTEFKALPALGYVYKSPWSYQDLGNFIVAISKKLKEAGLCAGDKVAILSENQPAWGAVYLAVTSSGMTIVPLLPDFAAREVGLILAHSEAKAIFISEKQAAKVSDEEFAGNIFPLESVPQLETPSAEEISQFWDSKGPSEEDLAAIIYTSGTTGDPKGVMLLHKNLCSNVISAERLPNMKTGESMLSILPLSHTFECTLGFLLPMAVGANVYYLDKPPIPAVLLPALAEVRPHLILSVPLFIEKIYRGKILQEIQKNPIVELLYKLPPIRKLFNKLAGKKLYALFGGRLHFFGIGGAALAREVDRFLYEAHFPYAIGYGLTETAPLVAGAGPALTKKRSTGPVLEGVKIKIDQPSRSGIGEILVKGPNVMAGYFKSAEKTAQVMSSDGWFHTGDLGRFKKDFLYITGRLKNVIIGANGENIYPETIEAVINEFKYVAESVVIEKGGRLLARVHINYQELLQHHHELEENAEKLKQWMSVFFHELKEKVNHQLSSFNRISVIVEQAEPFEKTPTLKIKRFLYA